MSSEDPGQQDQPPSDDTVPYGQAPAGGGNPYGAPAGGEEAHGQPSGGAHGVYGEPPYGAPSYPPPSQPYGAPSYPPPGQPSGYPPPPPQQWGHPQQQPGYPYGGGYPQQSDGLALAAMITGILSLVLTCGYGIGLLGSPVALVLGRVSMKRIDRSGGRLAGRGMAKTGFILGIIGTVLLVLALVALVVVVVVAVNGGFDSNNTPANPSYNS